MKAGGSIDWFVCLSICCVFVLLLKVFEERI